MNLMEILLIWGVVGAVLAMFFSLVMLESSDANPFDWSQLQQFIVAFIFGPILWIVLLYLAIINFRVNILGKICKFVFYPVAAFWKWAGKINFIKK